MKTARDHSDIVKDSFGPRASEYLHIAVHAGGEDLAWLARQLEGCGEAELLDLGCGGGHVSYAAAERVWSVTAYDMSEDMLEVVRWEADACGLANVTVKRGVAETLPFAEGSFDMVASRYSAHHWRDVGGAMREIRRVLKPGGVLLIVDVATLGHSVADIYLQAVEMLRDASHVRAYSPAQWLELTGQAGLRLEALGTFRLRLEFGSWIARMRTPEVFSKAILALQDSVSDEVRDYFGIEADGSFSVDGIMLRATKASA